MTRAQMMRAINAEINRENRDIKHCFTTGRLCQREAEACVRNGDTYGAGIYLMLNREYMERIGPEMRAIKGKMKIRNIVDAAREDATEQEIHAAAVAERASEQEDIDTLRQEAARLIPEAMVLLGRGQTARGHGKLHRALEKLARAQREADVVMGKALATSVLPPGD